MRTGICASRFLKALLLCSLIICGFSCIPDEGNNTKATLYPTPVSTTSLDDLPTSTWIGPDGEAEYEYVPKHGFQHGANGHVLLLINNPQAHDPTLEELLDFLQQDDTDKQLYSDSFVCADFAEMLHNNAENAGIMAAYVTVGFENTCTEHALNAFNTTDKGLIFISAMRARQDRFFPCSFDKTVQVELYKQYQPSLLFPCEDYELDFDTEESSPSVGNVSEIYIQW